MVSCWRHRFHNQYEASSWGPAYQCPKCGWWHIRFICFGNWPWPLDKTLFWAALILVFGYIDWILINAFIAWNWPS